MKELPIEEKAKRYDEAIEKAKYYYAEGKTLEYAIDIVSDVFPELKESEDESIIRDIHVILESSATRFFKENGQMPVWYDRAVAWLEKQGEQEQDPCEHCKDKCLNCHNFPCIDKRAFEQGKSALETIKEEKVDNANKIEPKFKNGQWIVWQDKCYKVNYNGCGYELVGQNGLSTSLEYGTIDESAHLWDITKDAKDGDMLHCWIDGDEFVLIYRGIKDGYITTYGHLYQKFKLFAEEPTTMFCRTIQGHFTPATKEQRDLLFKKMHDAGYEWDAEKKELKKIEEKTAWSEEDETIKNNISHIIRQYDKISKKENQPCWYIGDCLLWIQNIKDRVQPQPKQEWNEKDEKAINDIMWIIEAYRENGFNETHKQIANNAEKWLKSLRPQNNWKPSDEQMDALQKVINRSPNRADDQLLGELLKQLQKLVE